MNEKEDSNIYIEAIPAALSVLDGLTEDPGYKDLSDEDKAYFRYHIKSKAIHLHGLQVAIMRGNIKAEKAEREALLDLKGIETGLDLIAGLEVNKRLIEASQALMVQALRLAVGVLL